MALISLRQLLDHAAEHHYGLPAFNVNNMEQIQAIMTAAQKTQSPVIIQASRGALKYSNFTYLKYLMIAAAEENPEIKLSMHLDHGNSLDTCKKAIALGFTSVMIDGSLLEDGKTANPSHTSSPVQTFVHSSQVKSSKDLQNLSGLKDIAPLCLKIMQLPIPKEMLD